MAPASAASPAGWFKSLPFMTRVLCVTALAMAVLVAGRAYVMEPFVVPTGSMEPTIRVGDHLFGEKVTYAFRRPQAGEIVFFWSAAERSVLVKRIIATEGQTVDVSGGSVLVDGKRVDEPYVHGARTEPLKPLAHGFMDGAEYPVTVPEGCLWVMGDNREQSRDSRYFGPVSVEDVRARALFIYLPFSHAGPVS